MSTDADAIVAEFSVRLDDPQSETLPARLLSWRDRLASVKRIPGPAPLTSITGLAQALVFDDDVDAAADLSAQHLVCAPIDVFLAGGAADHPDAAVRLAEVLELLAAALRSDGAPAHPTVAPTALPLRLRNSRRWATVRASAVHLCAGSARSRLRRTPSSRSPDRSPTRCSAGRATPCSSITLDAAG